MNRIVALFCMSFILFSCEADNTSNSTNTDSELKNEQPVVADSQVDTVKMRPLNTERRVAIETPEISWVFDRRDHEEEMLQRTFITLVADGKNYFVDSTIVADEMELSQYAQHSIPKEAITAAGGFYAGLGEYYYVIREGNMIVVYETFMDEGMEGMSDPEVRIRIPL